MNKPSFVYATYIAATPEKVWGAITNPEIARRYWFGPNGDCARVNVSDWKKGSRWEHQRADGTKTVDIAGTVVESDPPRRLVMTWARPQELDDDSKHSRVTFEIEVPREGLVRLTVLHEDLERDPKMLDGISKGWPSVLSNLKTLLETGQPLFRLA
jgi:uncharacterized protein YndB with AHSA1/START domain